MAVDFVAINIGLALASAVVYSAVGYQVGRRPASPDAQLAKRMFQAWWYGLAGLSLFTPLVAILAQYGLDTFDTMLLLVQALLIIIFAAIAGLVYYLLYLYTGRSWVLGAVAAYFVVMLVWLEYIMSAAHLASYATPPGGGPKTFLDEHGQKLVTSPIVGLLFGLLVAVPPLGSAVAYFLLYFKVDGAEQKYRIAVVSAALVLWFASSVLGTLTGYSNSQDQAVQQTWQVANMLIALAASTAVYLAYRPPTWVQRRLHLEMPAGRAG